MTTRQELLIDVRSPAEFATGPLTSDIAPTVNIEYQSISLLPDIYAARGITVDKDDNITLYCRSGRRSGIAKQTLEDLGFRSVRDIGGLDVARKVLDKEQVGRQLDGEIESLDGKMNGEGEVEHEVKAEDPRRHVRAKSFGKLVEGLRALEG